MEFSNKTTTTIIPLLNSVTRTTPTLEGDSRDGSFVDPITFGAIQIFFCVLYATVFVLGVFGNALVCYVVLRNRAMQTVTNIFITNLALSDILLCLFGVPFTPMYTFLGRWAFGKTLCHFMPFAQGCSIYISTLTLTSIAIDRYFVIIYPFKPRMKLSTCITIIIAIWMVSLLATLPYGLYMKIQTPILGKEELHQNSSSMGNNTLGYLNNENMLQNLTDTITLASALSSTDNRTEPITTTIEPPLDIKYYCEENWPSEECRKVFGSVTTILQFVLPFVIISICYIWVSIKLNARTRLKPGYKSSRREEADRDRKKRTNIMLISMVAVFGLSWLPLNVVNILADFFENTDSWTYYNLVFFVTHAIAMSSTCYNPFLYAWLNENFRKEFKHVLPCFNPSNDGLMGRMYNRSERNTCGPKLHDAVDNVTVIPDRTLTSNDNSNDIVGISKTNYQKCVNILLNDDCIKNKLDKAIEDGNENVLELKSNEIPFINSSDNNATSTSNLDNTEYTITDIE